MSVEAFVPSRHLSFEAFVLLVDKCQYRHLSFEAFVCKPVFLYNDLMKSYVTGVKTIIDAFIYVVNVVAMFD